MNVECFQGPLQHFKANAQFFARRSLAQKLQRPGEKPVAFIERLCGFCGVEFLGS